MYAINHCYLDGGQRRFIGLSDFASLKQICSH